MSKLTINHQSSDGKERFNSRQVAEVNAITPSEPIKQSIARLRSGRAMDKVFEENYDVLEVIGND